MKKIFPMALFMKKMVPVALLSAILIPLDASAEIKAGSVEISPFIGYNVFENRQNLENRPVFGGRLGYNFTENFGIEAVGEYIRTRVDDKRMRFTQEGQFTSPIDGVDIAMYHLDLIYHFIPSARFNPFIAAGYGAAHYSPKINDKNMSVINFGGGAKLWLTDHIALRLDLRDNMILDEQIHNFQATMGVVVAFGGTAKSEPAPKAKDSDGDGVEDGMDKCPDTPAGVSVDRNGCPLDSDKDGISDYLDKCPDTPVGVAVGKDGCPLDADGDGVIGYLDKCPGTPVGVAVDRDGCPIVVEKVLILVSEPKVEEKVKEKAKAASAEPKVIILAFEDVHFEFDQSTLKPEAKAVLKRNIQLLKENPKAKIRVAGYTSASGTTEYNQRLSERRAEAVKAYLISEGIIVPNRLSTIGYGETHPANYEAAPKEVYSPAAKSNMRVLFEIILE